jgi:hypothetical protein
MKVKIPSTPELLLIFTEKELIKCENQVHMNYY